MSTISTTTNAPRAGGRVCTVGKSLVFAAGLLALSAGCSSARRGLAVMNAAGGEATKSGLAELRVQRARLARRRRVIFNNDGCDALYFPANQAPTPANFLGVRTRPLLGSDVTTVSYCTISSGFGNFTHRTRVGSVLTRDMPFWKGHRNITRFLIARGTDPLALVVDFCRQNRLECFWSMRMNDTHDQSDRPGKPYPLFPKWKRQHPEWLVGSLAHPPPYGAWSAADYGRRPVREMAYAFIREVCRNYDIDGIELDFLRHPCYFKSVAYGGKASRRECAAMTGLLRRVRALTERIGLERGRPILVSARVPTSPAYARAIGLDIREWLRQGLVDFLIGSDYFRLQSWADWARLGREYGVPMAAGLSESRVQGETRFQRQSRESYCARALRAWRAGLNAVYIFNVYNASAPFLRDIGNPEKLDTRDKLYFATVRDGSPAAYLAGGNAYRELPVLTPSHPWQLEPGRERTLTLVLGDSPAAAGKRAGGVRAACHIRLPGGIPGDALEFTVNGVEMKTGIRTGDWLDYPVVPLCLHRGKNRFGFRLRKTLGEKKTNGWDVEYRCDHRLAYPKQLPWRRAFAPCRFTEEIRNGALYFADDARGPEACPALVYPWKITPETRVVVEARCRVLRSTAPAAVCIRVSNGRNTEILTLEPGRIGLRNARLHVPFPTTEGFHTYRIVIDGHDIQVFADGKLRLDGHGRFTAPAGDRRTWIPLIYGLEDWNRCCLLFGSGSGPGTGAALWRFIRFRTDRRVALLEDFVLGIDYFPFQAKP